MENKRGKYGWKISEGNMGGKYDHEMLPLYCGTEC